MLIQKQKGGEDLFREFWIKNTTGERPFFEIMVQKYGRRETFFHVWTTPLVLHLLCLVLHMLCFGRVRLVLHVLSLVLHVLFKKPCAPKPYPNYDFRTPSHGETSLPTYLPPEKKKIANFYFYFLKINFRWNKFFSISKIVTSLFLSMKKIDFKVEIRNFCGKKVLWFCWNFAHLKIR